MKINHIIILVLITCNACSGQKAKDDKSTPVQKETTVYGKFVPVILGIHNEYKEKDSLKVEFVNDVDSVSFIHLGAQEGWGMRMTGKKIRTGNYKLILSWYGNGKPMKTKKDILIKPETEFFSLNIELANDLRRGREFNAIYLDQYTNNLKSVEFRRAWDPQKQFQKDSLLVPDYEVTNKNDSTLYGAYLRFSTQLSINWVEPHNIAFMSFEQKTDSGWINLSCNAPRIEMDLKKGNSGKTLKDMVLGCPVNYFKPGEKYRLRIDYMIDNRTFERNPASGEYEDNVYVEQTIYMYTDEFQLK
jgi:hypothetical protein